MKYNIWSYCFNLRYYPSAIAQAAIFDEYIIKIMLYRTGLDRIELRQKIRKEASCSVNTINQVAAYCLELVKERKPFPWEEIANEKESFIYLS